MTTLRKLKHKTPFETASFLFASIVIITLGGCSQPEQTLNKGIKLPTYVMGSSQDYDSVGIYHNAAIRYAFTQVDTVDPILNPTLYIDTMLNAATSWLSANMDGLASSTATAFEDTMEANLDSMEEGWNGLSILDTMSDGLTTKEKLYINRMGTSLLIANSTSSTMDSIYAIDSAIAQDTWASGENHAQIAISVLKYSSIFWQNEGFRRVDTVIGKYKMVPLSTVGDIAAADAGGAVRGAIVGCLIGLFGGPGGCAGGAGYGAVRGAIVGSIMTPKKAR